MGEGAEASLPASLPEITAIDDDEPVGAATRNTGLW
jgi:hypothetical protein